MISSQDHAPATCRGDAQERATETYSVERIRSALGACNALIVGDGPGPRRHWERVEAVWRERLAEAERVSP